MIVDTDIQKIVGKRQRAYSNFTYQRRRFRSSIQDQRFLNLTCTWFCCTRGGMQMLGINMNNEVEAFDLCYN